MVVRDYLLIKRRNSMADMSSGKEPEAIFFSGYAATVKQKKEFLLKYVEHEYRMKPTCDTMEIAYGTLTGWTGKDQAFRAEYYRLKGIGDAARKKERDQTLGVKMKWNIERREKAAKYLKNKQAREEKKRKRVAAKKAAHDLKEQRKEEKQKFKSTLTGERFFAKYTPSIALAPELEAELKQAVIQNYKDSGDGMVISAKRADVSVPLFHKWKKEDAEFKGALTEIRKEKVPWVQIEDNEIGSALEKAHKMILEKTKEKQDLWLKNFIDYSFNIADTCKAVGIRRVTVNQWRDNYPEFKAIFDEICEEKKDFVESKLLENIKANDSACIIYACKTLLKDRGYGDKKEVELSGDFGVMVVPGRATDVAGWAIQAKAQQKQLGESNVRIEQGLHHA